MSEYIPVAALDDLPVGERLFVDIGSLPVVIFHTTEGLCAIRDTCTHDNGPLGEGELSGTVIKCPRHGARFDICSGKALSAPAFRDTPAYPVRVVDGMIEILISQA